MCDFSIGSVLNARSHNLHGTCLESEWHKRWYFREVVDANFFSQWLQENLPSFLRIGFLWDTILGIPVPDAILFVLRLRLATVNLSERKHFHFLCVKIFLKTQKNDWMAKNIFKKSTANNNVAKNKVDDGDDNDDWTPRLFLAWRVLASRPPFPWHMSLY